MADDLSIKDTNETYAQLAALFEHLLNQNDEAIRRDPALAESLARLSNEAQRRFEDSQRSQPVPPDGGLSDLLGFSEEATDRLTDLSPPPLLPSIDEAVVSERLLGVADLYYVMKMEAAEVFRSVTALQQLFRRGQTRLSNGPGAYRLYKFDQQKILRSTQRERLEAYARVFGYGPRDTGFGKRNESFHGLFAHFITQVSRFFRDTRISALFQQGGSRAGERAFGSIAMVRRSGLNVRANLKQASYGHVNVLRIEAMQMLQQAFAIFDSDDVKTEYGAEDGWDALHQIARRHLKGAQNTTRNIRLAETGREIIIWLAQPYLQATTRAAFETALLKIGDSCDEWLTTSASGGIIESSDNRIDSENVVALHPSRSRPLFS
ncbi:MAG: hypothetical protein QNJ92_12680 [Alphaproteobacteria bacterium]|nr:hypothetical protein [Alphaproteobacteria bacterium]